MKRLFALAVFVAWLLCGLSAPGHAQLMTIYQAGEAYSVLGGSAVLGDDGYLNFNHLAGLGSAGYGIRDNAGAIEVKDEGGAWAAIGGGGSSTSITQGGGSCTVDANGAIDCTPASGQDFTVTLAGGGAAVVTGGNVELASGTRIIVPDGETFITGTDADSGLRFFSNKNLSFYVDSVERVRFGSGGRVSTTDGISAGTSILGSDVVLARSAANVWRVSSNGSTGDADLWVNRAIGIGAVTPSIGMLHIDKGTGFGQATLDGSSGGCLMLRDTDDAGWTEISVLNGTITATTDADGVCDGS